MKKLLLNGLLVLFYYPLSFSYCASAFLIL